MCELSTTALSLSLWITRRLDLGQIRRYLQQFGGTNLVLSHLLFQRQRLSCTDSVASHARQRFSLPIRYVGLYGSLALKLEWSSGGLTLRRRGPVEHWRK